MRPLLRRSRPEVDAPPPPVIDAPVAVTPDLLNAALVDPLQARSEPTAAPPTGPVTEELYRRLQPGDVEAVVAALEGDTRVLWERASPDERRTLAPVFAAVYDVPGVLERTGLVRAQPPEDVHAMARGTLAYAGEPVLADLVVRALDEAGTGLPATGSVLDFGCSSGRVVRVLAAYRPDLDWLGCDPNEAAIGWASEHLPMARFFVSASAPPLPLENVSIDGAYAISIWSHFSAGAAEAWLQEMHRVIRPGGTLLLTTHGLDTLGHQLRHGLMTRESAADSAAALLRDGHSFYAIFGDEGDWGVRDPHWGTGYLGADWVAEHATPDWAIRLFRPGMLDRNQDVFVLERRP